VTAPERRFEVAFLCTGNRFRSPLAAALLEAEVGGQLVETASAGVLELGPVPALPEAVKLGQSFGVELEGHRAQDLAQLDLDALDLVLCFEQLHVRAAVVDGLAPIERTFTLPELVDLLEALSDPASLPGRAEQARARIAQASAARPPGFRTRPVPEIADPLGRDEREQRRIADELRALVRRLAHALFG
jgi:protein-tyrosine phosphatase